MKTVTFGEIMLRLSTPGFSRIVQSDTFNATFGGGEANVAVALANYGLDSYFLSRLPDHEVGQAALNTLRRYGVKTDHIIQGGHRVGIYYLETGASQRASKVIYDRSSSAFSEIQPGMIDWDTIFAGAKWFHWTGITPALGKNIQECLQEACISAQKAGVMVSCDLNYRKKLWTEKQAQQIMNPLMEYVDVCIANEEDAEKCLGFIPAKSDVENAQIDADGYSDMAIAIKKKYGFKSVAITLRESFSASRNGWSALFHDSQSCSNPVRSTRFDIQIVDRVGGGDSFASGLIYGLLTYPDTRDALEFAVAASCLKHTIPGDFNLISVQEVENLVKGGGSGRVER